MTIKAVFLDLDSVARQDLDLSRLEAVADWDFYSSTSAKQCLSRIRGKQVVVTNKVVIDRALMQQSPGLKLIAVAATGVNNIDLGAANELGIAVKNVTAYGTESVVQHVFMLLFNLMTRFNDYQQAISCGDWHKSEFFCLLDYPIHTLAGKKMGIVGYGELGKAVSNAAKAFGAEVLIAQRPGDNDMREGRMPLDQLISESDVISLHCPLAENTQNLLDKRRIGLMKPSAFLLNTARGGLVDEQALLDALKQQDIAGAGFDTLVVEPPTSDSPLLSADLLNLIITPHIAWAAVESRQNLVDKVADNIQLFFN